jgi:hypothetical protein
LLTIKQGEQVCYLSSLGACFELILLGPSLCDL